MNETKNVSNTKDLFIRQNLERKNSKKKLGAIDRLNEGKKKILMLLLFASYSHLPDVERAEKKNLLLLEIAFFFGCYFKDFKRFVFCYLNQIKKKYFVSCETQ